MLGMRGYVERDSVVLGHEREEKEVTRLRYQDSVVAELWWVGYWEK